MKINKIIGYGILIMMLIELLICSLIFASHSDSSVDFSMMVSATRDIGIVVIGLIVALAFASVLHKKEE